MTDRRVVIVANRLPVKFDGGNVVQSSGGLVSALSGIPDMLWIGWAGGNLPDSVTLPSGLIPVDIPEDLVDLYYNGYSNNLLWPCFHYIPLPIVELNQSHTCFEAYKAVNQLFADVILASCGDNDIIWIQDYHLMLLPAMIRKVLPNAMIGFFLHTPFPSSEIYRAVPQRSELLKGVLSANLVGFHTYDYARHFTSSCKRLLQVDTNQSMIHMGSSITTVGAFPIGINPNKFKDALESEQVEKAVEVFRAKFAGKHVIVGVDRLDHIKGIPQKLYGLEAFFEKYPEFVSKVVLVQIAIPSRTSVREYKQLAQEVHELVGRINGRFGSVAHVPIHLLDQSIAFPEMCALFKIADACLITSLRDGMNLVAYEYVMCQRQPDFGVLILSEFAGATQSLGSGAITVNPWDVSCVSNAIHEALTMDLRTRQDNIVSMQRYIEEHSASYWAKTFITSLLDTVQSQGTAALPIENHFTNIRDQFSAASSRLVILGLTGTLTAPRKHGERFYRSPSISAQEHIGLNSTARNLLESLSKDPKTTVIVVSSRRRELLDSVVDIPGLYLLAENGFYFKNDSLFWKSVDPNLDPSLWISEVERVLEYFTERTPGSFIDYCDSFLSWHYRDCAAPDFAERQALDLCMHLTSGSLANLPVEINHSHYLVQVRCSGTSKGTGVAHVLKTIASKFDVALCMGNFLPKDEDIFSTISDYVNSDPFTVTVGDKTTKASYFARDVIVADELLGLLSHN